MKWTEGEVHVAMRRLLRGAGWQLIAGEFPGGSDHELYPLNVVDPRVARDASPDPRRHSLGELIPDLVALRGRDLAVLEAKVRYDDNDRVKLETLLTARRADLLVSLARFAADRRVPQLLPIETLVIHPVLAFAAKDAPPAPPPFSYLRVESRDMGHFEGVLAVSR